MTRPFEDMLSAWGIVGETPQITGLTGELRSNEDLLRREWLGLAPGDAAALLWQMVAKGVGEAQEWGGSAPLDALCERALRLRGGPKEGVERKMMRERARVLLHVQEPSDKLPRDSSNLLGMWDEATRLEPCVRLRVDTPRWRTTEDGLPFTGMSMVWLFDTPLPLAPCAKTADPSDIPQFVDGLLDFVGNSGLSPEVTAAHVIHLLCYIHPFADGNGHTSRLFLCDLLMRAGYGAPTLVSYVNCYHSHRKELSELIRSVLLGDSSADELVCFQLRLLIEAQTLAMGV